jgi:hypothetical protein
MKTAAKRVFEVVGTSNGHEDAPTSVLMELNVTDSSSVQELLLRNAGRERDEYALGALGVGLLSLKHARGQVDAVAVRSEGDRILKEMNAAFEHHRTQLNSGVTGALKEYFDPKDGRFQERVERLIKKDGELEQVLRRQVGADESELAAALARHVGENSPIMNILDPEQAGGVVAAIRQSAESVLRSESERVLAEFSLDNKEGAMSRMVAELTENNGKLTGDLTARIDDAIKEFSLDKDDSALSRLVRKVETAQKTIANEFSLDNSDSALARLKDELLTVLTAQNDKNAVFQREVSVALETIKAKREESLRSTRHGVDFETKVTDFVLLDAERKGDICELTGSKTGAIKSCKVGDATVELGPDCSAAGVKFVVEAKEKASYDLAKAIKEIEVARKNRNAAVGLFVFSKKTAPTTYEPVFRMGNDVFAVWDDEDLGSDVILRVAISLAKALCVRESTKRDTEAAEFEVIDGAILAIEKEARRLGEMQRWTETIRSHSGKILEEIRKMTEGLEKQSNRLRDALDGIREGETA